MKTTLAEISDAAIRDAKTVTLTTAGHTVSGRIIAHWPQAQGRVVAVLRTGLGDLQLHPLPGTTPVEVTGSPSGGPDSFLREAL